MSGVRSLGTATALAAWRGWFAMPPIRASPPGFAPRRLGAGVPIDAAACRRKLAGVRAHPCTRASSATALAVVLYAKIRVQYRYSTVPARSVWDSPGQRALCAHTAFPKPVGGGGLQPVCSRCAIGPSVTDACDGNPDLVQARWPPQPFAARAAQTPQLCGAQTTPKRRATTRR